jgi:hypothetical protein
MRRHIWPLSLPVAVTLGVVKALTGRLVGVW